MASYPVPATSAQPSTYPVPYCCDPDCRYCQELREFQESIRTQELVSTPISNETRPTHP
jgi:hypothetical protein